MQRYANIGKPSYIVVVINHIVANNAANISPISESEANTAIAVEYQILFDKIVGGLVPKMYGVLGD